ncbi:hypothetical protein [Streptantibioticus ferralitis]|uniref:L,D-transpeptidase n=1 Tax=Streptantibioticus ferralitis TaxID=236510 RepID=A0ABT5Z2A4_9ACTN|nr:hypothetical protein [Streptantibioticus ferralitis]MDF2257976.1 hypothetical protein [Streptantibioticus ferralitis]
MARIASGTIVTGLTAAALAAIGVLAWQASAAPDHTGKSHTAPSASAAAQPSAAPSAAPSPEPTALPADSGHGKRVVYSLQQHRVWLVSASDQVEHTYNVTPGSVSPGPGTYTVTSRSERVTGTDGVPIEHVVRFAVVRGTTIGFSAAVDGSASTPQTGKKTGGVREQTADGAAMWQFALIGAKVIVVR